MKFEKRMHKIWDEIDEGHDRPDVVYGAWCDGVRYDMILDDPTKNPKEYSLFDFACKRESYRIAKALVKSSSAKKVEVATFWLNENLEKGGTDEMALFLLGLIGDINELQTLYNVSFLHAAIENNRHVVWTQLLERGCDVNRIHGPPEQSPMDVAILQSFRGTHYIDDLIARGAIVNKSHAVECVTWGAHPDIMRRFIVLGSDPNYTNSFTTSTPLLWACDMNQVELAKLLLYYGADKFAANQRGQTPISIVQRSGSKEMRELFDNHPFPLQTLLLMDRAHNEMKAHIQSLRDSFSLSSSSSDSQNPKRSRTQ